MASHLNGHEPIFNDTEGDYDRPIKSKDGLYATTVTQVEEPVEV